MAQAEYAILHVGCEVAMMTRWRFLDYITRDGSNLIQQWYTLQDAEVRAEFDATVLVLRSTQDWENPPIDEFKVLTGQHRGLAEVRFWIDVQRPFGRRTKRRFRPLGVYRPDAHEFVFLLGCEKQGMTVIPHGAFERALVLRAKLERGEGSTHEHH